MTKGKWLQLIARHTLSVNNNKQKQWRNNNKGTIRFSIVKGRLDRQIGTLCHIDFFATESHCSVVTVWNRLCGILWTFTPCTAFRLRAKFLHPRVCDMFSLCYYYDSYCCYISPAFTKSSSCRSHNSSTTSIVQHSALNPIKLQCLQLRSQGSSDTEVGIGNLNSKFVKPRALMVLILRQALLLSRC